MFDVNFAGMCFLFTPRFFSNVSLRFGWLWNFISVVFYISVAFCYLLAKCEPYLMFNSACSEKTLFTFCSSYASSVVVSPSGFLLRTSINFKLSVYFLQCVQWQYQSELTDLTILSILRCIANCTGSFNQRFKCLVVCIKKEFRPI